MRGVACRNAIALLAALAALSGACTPKKSGASAQDAGGSGATADAATDGGASGDASAAESSTPPAGEGEITTRMHHLLDAVVEDEPDLAKDVLFPRDAWMELSDASDPGKAWDKMVASFEREVHRIHRRTRGVANGKFVSFELGNDVARTTGRGTRHHEWKRAVWHARHAKLTFAIDDKTRRIDVVDLVAYKGAWYVTRIR